MAGKFKGLKLLAYLSLTIGLVALLWTLILVFRGDHISWLTAIDLDKASKIGDFLGGFVGLFWTIAGVLLVFLTLRMQSDEFQSTRGTVMRQQFESTFFNMLSIINSKRGEISVIPEEADFIGDTLKGFDFFDYFMERVGKSYQNSLAADLSIKSVEEKIKDKDLSILQLDVKALQGTIKSAFSITLEKYEGELGHYLRFLIGTITYCIESRSKYEDEVEFLTLLQNQLSNSELALIMYAGMSDFTPKGSKEANLFRMVNRYGLIDTIPKDRLLDSSHFVLYPHVNFRFLNRDEVEYKTTLQEKGVLGNKR